MKKQTYIIAITISCFGNLKNLLNTTSPSFMANYAVRHVTKRAILKKEKKFYYTRVFHNTIEARQQGEKTNVFHNYRQKIYLT